MLKLVPAKNAHIEDLLFLIDLRKNQNASTVKLASGILGSTLLE
ncbi:unnamed protein product [marine sediment metagenome]|uniref:Uncharacterized protein n=1 Tax=marine sediment metagenome TaxID=412755 RepID=X1BF63_9ZZZZ